jgi:NAD-dependent DNA ligase
MVCSVDTRNQKTYSGPERKEGSMKGQILIAKDRNHVQAVKANIDPTLKNRYTGMEDHIPAGAMVLCVQEVQNTRVHYIFVLHGEMTWEANPAHYEVVEASTKLAGKSFCFTGALTHTREYYKALVELHEGSFATSVSKNTSFLVMADPRSRSTKAEKARAQGVTCIGEDDLLGLIR